MRFTQFPPPEQLADVVRCFWTVDSAGERAAERSFNTMADGFPGLMVLLPGGAPIVDSEHGPMAPAFLYGQATTWRQLSANGRLHALGLFFQPHALRSLFGLAAPDHTDGCLDLARTTEGAALCTALASIVSAEEGMALLGDHLINGKAAHQALHDPLIAEAAARIIGANGDLELHPLYAEAGITERTFERRFKQSVGLTPRLFARIRRFQHTLGRMRSGDFTKLSDVAYAADYADQSHYIRSFREFTGIAPLEFRRDGREVVENLVELPPDGA